MEDTTDYGSHIAQFLKLMKSIAAEIPELIEQDEAMIGEGKKKDEGEQVEKAEEEGREKGEAVVELREEEQDNGIDALLAGQLPIRRLGGSCVFCVCALKNKDRRRLFYNYPSN